MNNKLPIDPRTAILLLLAANVVSFLQGSLFIEIPFILFLCVILLMCDCRKAVFKWCATYIGVILCQYILFPLTSKVFLTSYSIIFVYLRKILPCLMVGTIIVKKLKLSYIKFGLERWNFPRRVIIPMLITVRYIPSIIEERKHIKDAMKIRDIKGFSKIEYTLVPLIMSAINTSDELSAAAVTRGIENPCQKTSIIDIKMKTFDYTALTISFIFMSLSIYSSSQVI
mgnify:CR=1 FL=1